jgi:uncharacterized small protein (DUF1192 family)
MLMEDDLPRPTPALVGTPPLDRLGVAELERYVAALRAEIGRAEAEIVRKKAVLDAAHGFFRTP